jgi:hypothetical protein
MKAIQAFRKLLGIAPQTQPTVDPTPVDPVATSLEDVLARVNVAAANGESVAFLSAPDMDFGLFKEYVGALREAFEKDRAAGGAGISRVVILPPGVRMSVVNAASGESNPNALAHAAYEEHFKDMQPDITLAAWTYIWTLALDTEGPITVTALAETNGEPA